MKWTNENVIFVSYALYAVVFGTIKTMKHKKNFSFQISIFNVTAHKMFNDKWLQGISHIIY